MDQKPPKTRAEILAELARAEEEERQASRVIEDALGRPSAGTSPNQALELGGENDRKIEAVKRELEQILEDKEAMLKEAEELISTTRNLIQKEQTQQDKDSQQKIRVQLENNTGRLWVLGQEMSKLIAKINPTVFEYLVHERYRLAPLETESVERELRTAEKYIIENRRELDEAWKILENNWQRQMETSSNANLNREAEGLESIESIIRQKENEVSHTADIIRTLEERLADVEKALDELEQAEGMQSSQKVESIPELTSEPTNIEQKNKSFKIEEIKQVLYKILMGFDAVKKVNNLEITKTPSGNRFILDAKITVKKLVTIDIELNGLVILNTPDGNIEIASDYDLRASKMEGTVRDLFDKHLGSVGGKLKEYIGKEEGRSVDKVAIEDGKLKVTFK